MHHLVVADGQHKVFAKSVEKAKSNAVVVALAEQWIQAHIPEHIVHPAHIPLKVKAQAAYIRGHGDHGPSRGFLGDHEDDRIYEFAEKPAQPKSNKASMGVYVFSWSKLRQYLELDEADPNSANDFGKNVIPAMLNAGERLFAYPFSGYWKDVGTIDLSLIHI